ncbi:hypothetical protein V8F20_003093 [Naviculisporaceae sp. PSN 640]
MGNYMSVEHAQSAHGPVDFAALFKKLSSRQRRLLRLGLVRSKDWTQLPTEGIYQIVISEILETGSAHALVHGGSRAFAVTAVLDLGLRMLESPRGRQALQNLALRTFRCICPESEKNLGHLPHTCPDSQLELQKANLPGTISEFLRSVRYRFPTVILDKRTGFQDKSFSVRQHGSHNDEDFWCSHIPTLETLKFNPKEDAVLHLSWELVDKLFWTKLKADTGSLPIKEKGGEESAKIVRFKRLQFHLATMVSHHLCHLFIGFLRGSETLFEHVDDVRVLRLVNRYDAGAEFENEFFGGRPKMFIDQTFGDAFAPQERYAGESYLVKRGEDSRRVAATIPLESIEDYLKGDFSHPLLPPSYSEKHDSRFELYRDVKRRHEENTNNRRRSYYGDANDEKVQITTNKTERASQDSSDKFSLPWDITGEEYGLLKKACYNPSVRLVDTLGY